MSDYRTLLAPAAAVLALVGTVSTFTCKGAQAADTTAGKATYQACAPCHGPNAVSTMENVPSLAGQPDYFLQYQLLYFRGGSRKNEIMQPVADGLSDEDVRNLGAYLSHLPGPPAPAGAPLGPADPGRKLVTENHCDSCHGPKLEGTQAVARLVGQREEYVLKALRDFKSGARSGSGMAAMADVVYPLSDADLVTLAHTVVTYQP